MLSVVNLLRGYAEIRVSGAFPERFLNICARGGVPLWKLKRHADGSYTARVRASQAYLLDALAERSMCCVERHGTRGAPSFAQRFAGRYVFLAGMAVCIIFVLAMSQRVWEFEVVGNETVSGEIILRRLAAQGVKPGVRISDIDPDLLEDILLVEIPELRWLTVNCNGSIATVEVRERVPKPYIPDEKQPANVVASKSGQIEKIAVLEGSPQAVIGDVVERGQLLASGIIDTSSGARVVHAMADVTAKTWYTLQAAAPVSAVYKLSDGGETVKRAVILGGMRINLYFNSSIIHTECDKIIERTRLALPGGLKLPIEWERAAFSTYSPSPGEQDGEDVEAALAAKLMERLDRESGGAEVIDTLFEYEERDGMLYATLTATCREEIAMEIDIPFDRALFGW